MAINREDIIEDLERHMRKSGGELSAWCAGTAKDASGPFFQRHEAAEVGDGLAYREAYTSGAAEAVIEHLVQQDGLRPDRDAVPEGGKIVFVYRQAA
jgi:hypothetical protein